MSVCIITRSLGRLKNLIFTKIGIRKQIFRCENLAFFVEMDLMNPVEPIMKHPLLASPGSSKANLEFEQEELARLRKQHQKTSRLATSKEIFETGQPGSETSSIKSRHSLDEKTLVDKTLMIQHVVQSGDTLEGICVMYHAKIADVKRINRLWTNDSLYLRKTLDIPIQESKSPKEDSKNSKRPLSLPTRPPEAFTSVRASSSSDSLSSKIRKNHVPSRPNSPTHFKRSIVEGSAPTPSPFAFGRPGSPTKPPVSTQELLDCIDKDVSSIIAALKESDLCMDPSSNMPRKPQKLRDLRSKTTRVTITPIEPSAASAFMSAQAPLRVVFTLTPLLGHLPQAIQESVKEDVVSKLKKSLSVNFLKRARIQTDEWVDMVTIDKTEQTTHWDHSP